MFCIGIKLANLLMIRTCKVKISRDRTDNCSPVFFVVTFCESNTFNKHLINIPTNYAAVAFDNASVFSCSNALIVALALFKELLEPRRFVKIF